MNNVERNPYHFTRFYRNENYDNYSEMNEGQKPPCKKHCLPSPKKVFKLYNIYD